MKTNKKYSVIVMAIAIIASLVLFGCPDDSSSNSGGGGSTATGNPFNLANCYRIYGDDDCREVATGLVANEVIGTVSATGATAFAISAGNDNGNFAISSAGVLTAAKAVAVNAAFSQELTITITGGNAGTQKITVDNAYAKATVYEAPLGDRGVMAASTIAITETTVANECADSVKCISSTYPGAWGGWFFSLNSGTIDLTPYKNIFIRYNAVSGIANFEFKMESTGVSSSAYLLNGAGTPARVSITANGEWQTAMIPLAVLKGAKDGNRGGNDAAGDDAVAGLNIAALTVPVGIWNQGTGNALVIADVYAR